MSRSHTQPSEHTMLKFPCTFLTSKTHFFNQYVLANSEYVGTMGNECNYDSPDGQSN